MRLLYLFIVTVLLSCNSKPSYELKTISKIKINEDSISIKNIPLKLLFLNDSSLLFNDQTNIYSLNPKTGNLVSLINIEQELQLNFLLSNYLKVDTNSSFIKRLNSLNIKSSKSSVTIRNFAVYKNKLHLILVLYYPTSNSKSQDNENSMSIFMDYARFFVSFNDSNEVSDCKHFKAFLDTIKGIESSPLSGFFIQNDIIYLANQCYNSNINFDYSIYSTFNINSLNFINHVPISFNTQSELNIIKNEAELLHIFSEASSEKNIFIENEYSIHNIQGTSTILNLKDYLSEKVIITNHCPLNEKNLLWFIQYLNLKDDKTYNAIIDIQSKKIKILEHVENPEVFINNLSNKQLYTFKKENDNYYISTIKYD